MEASAEQMKRYEADCWLLHSCYSAKVTSTDLRKVAEILTCRNLEELKLIRQTYSALFNEHLISNISRKNDLLSRVAYLRLSEPCDRDADMIRQALSSTRLDANTVKEIICTRSSSELKLIKQAYHARFNSEVERDVSLKISDTLKEVLLAILSSSNYCAGRPDMSMALCDAKTLYEAIGSGKSVDKKTIISLISQRNTSQLKAILESYKQLYGHELTEFLKSDKCGEFGRQLRVVIRCIQRPEKHFVKQIRLALHSGSIKEILVQTVVTRAEIDVNCISRALAVKTGWSLESLVRNEFRSNSTSVCDIAIVGDVLMALV